MRCRLSAICASRVVGVSLPTRREATQSTDNRQRARSAQLPIRSSHFHIPQHHRLTRQTFVCFKSALRRHASLDHRRRAEVFRSAQDADAASSADADAAAGVADGSIRAAGSIEHGLVRHRLGRGAERGESYAHRTILASSVHKDFASLLETFGGRRRLYMQDIGGTQ